MANRWKPFGSLFGDHPVSSPRAKPEEKMPARHPNRGCSAHQTAAVASGALICQAGPPGVQTPAQMLQFSMFSTIINSANAAKYKSTLSKNPNLKLCLIDTSLICRHSKDAWIANSTLGCIYFCCQSRAMEHIWELLNTKRSYYGLQMSVPQSKSCFISLNPGGEGRRNNSCSGCTEKGWASHH